MHTPNSVAQHKDSEDKQDETKDATEGAGAEGETTLNAEDNNDSLVDDKRLYLSNLSYQVTKEELQELFGKYGEIVDIEIPFRKHGRGVPLGIGFVRYVTSEAAISAFA